MKPLTLDCQLLGHAIQDGVLPTLEEWEPLSHSPHALGDEACYCHGERALLPPHREPHGEVTVDLDGRDRCRDQEVHDLGSGVELRLCCRCWDHRPTDREATLAELRFYAPEIRRYLEAVHAEPGTHGRAAC